ncbi:MAG: endonuclease III, partial [Defluviitaleaceae bacterium]|nr:endonuclease III [Defluviitaleaceae bacterium]
MLFATILSAQCTDALVNIVTAKLFKQYPTLESYTTASVSELEEALRQINYNNAKARYLQKTANMLITEFNSEVPSDITALTSLSGVGRKTANVVRGHIFKIPSIVVDTHVKRVSNRLGLTSHQDP